MINSAAAMQAGLVTVSNTMSYYQVAMAGDGTALAVWESQGHPGAYVQGARCSAAGDWELYSTPQDSEGGAQPQLAFSASGEVISAWAPNGFFNTTNAVRSSHYQPSVGWGALEFVQENGADYPQDLRLASGGSGHFAAVWSHATELQSTLWLNRYQSGSGWKSARQIATTSSLYPGAQVALDAAGNALLVWLTGDGTRGDLVAQEFPNQ